MPAREARHRVEEKMFELTVKLGDRLVQKFRGHTEANIGRDSGCELMLDNLGVSRRHAQLREVEGRFIVEDLKSTNGVFVNGRRVTSAEINPGDEIRIGKFSLTLERTREEPAAAVDALDINKTIAMEGLALPSEAAKEPEFAASISRQVFHKPDCNWIKATRSGHKVFFDTESDARQSGKRPCRTCLPNLQRF